VQSFTASPTQVLAKTGKFRGLLRLIRLPNLLIIALCQALVYWFLIPDTVKHSERPGSVLLVITATLLVAAAGYVINDYYDLKIDRVNKPERITVGRVVTRRKAMLGHLGLSAAGLLAALFCGWPTAFITALSAGLLWLYSAQLKKRPLIGNLAVALLAAAAVLVVGVYFREVNQWVLGFAGFSFLISLIREIIKDLEDREGDASFRCRTLPIVAGVVITKWVVGVLLLSYVLGLAWALPHLPDLLRWYTIVLLLLPALYFAWRLYYADRKAHFRHLSLISKLLMLAGIIAMTLVHI
jgi:4-hydroxybenzoate polyprenyltransferase